jgi:hypothetical protein
MSSSVSPGTRSAASKSVGPNGTEIIGRDGPALAVSGVATLLAAAAATGLVEDFAVGAMFIDVDGGGAEACAEETADSVRVKK